jgi:hypothetical protein
MNQTILVLRHLLDNNSEDIQNEVRLTLDTLEISHKLKSQSIDNETIQQVCNANGWLVSWLPTDNWLNLGLFLEGEQLHTASFCPIITDCINKTILPDCKLMIGLSWLKPHSRIPNHIGQTSPDPKGMTYRMFQYGLIVPSHCWVESQGLRRYIKEKFVVEINDRVAYSMGNDSDEDQVMLYLKVLDVMAE